MEAGVLEAKAMEAEAVVAEAIQKLPLPHPSIEPRHTHQFATSKFVECDAAGKNT